MDTRILKQFLNAGFIHSSVMYESTSGVPQGGIISPTIANMVLDGLCVCEANVYHKSK
jgi:RNA-directed DNA polymerase